MVHGRPSVALDPCGRTSSRRSSFTNKTLGRLTSCPKQKRPTLAHCADASPCDCYWTEVKVYSRLGPASTARKWMLSSLFLAECMIGWSSVHPGWFGCHWSRLWYRHRWRHHTIALKRHRRLAPPTSVHAQAQSCWLIALQRPHCGRPEVLQKV